MEANPIQKSVVSALFYSICEDTKYVTLSEEGQSTLSDTLFYGRDTHPENLVAYYKDTNTQYYMSDGIVDRSTTTLRFTASYVRVEMVLEANDIYSLLEQLRTLKRFVTTGDIMYLNDPNLKRYTREFTVQKETKNEQPS